jgi:hypothetical protein
MPILIHLYRGLRVIATGGVRVWRAAEKLSVRELKLPAR